MIAQSFERIHRSNLVNMGIWPLAFREGASVDTLGLVDVVGISVMALPSDFSPQMSVKVTATMKDGSSKQFDADVKVATRGELNIVMAGGLLPATLANVLGRWPEASVAAAK